MPDTPLQPIPLPPREQARIVLWGLRLAVEQQRKALPQISILDLTQVAWRARTLFELLIFCRYCAGNEEHCTRVFRDFLVDMRNLHGPSAADRSTWSEFEHVLFEAEQMYNPERSRLDIHKLAEEVGLKDEYDNDRKALHKQTHATAFSILTPIRILDTSSIFNQYLKAAYSYADRALACLKDVDPGVWDNSSPGIGF